MTESYPSQLQNTVCDVFEKAEAVPRPDRKAFVRAEMAKELKRAQDAVEFLELTSDEQALLVDYKIWKTLETSRVSGVFHWKYRET